jgi:hypothetical protein
MRRNEVRRRWLHEALDHAAVQLFDLARRGRVAVTAKAALDAPPEAVSPLFFDEPVRFDWTQGGPDIVSRVVSATSEDSRARWEARFSADDLMRGLGPHAPDKALETDSPPPMASNVAAPSKQGRRKGDGAFDDREHLDAMRRIMAERKLTSASRAATILVEDPMRGWGKPGGPEGNSPEAAIDRLRRKFRQEHPRMPRGAD